MTDNETKLKLAAKQPAQKVREEKMRIAFANMVVMLLRHLAGGDCLDDVPIREFLATQDAMRVESEDPKGIAVPMPDLASTDSDHPDTPINTLLRGALRQVAALLENPRMGEQKSENYEAAREELAEGLLLLNAKIGIPSPLEVQEVRRQIAEWALGKSRPRKDDFMRLLTLLHTNQPMLRRRNSGKVK